MVGVHTLPPQTPPKGASLHGVLMWLLALRYQKDIRDLIAMGMSAIDTDEENA